ncbi:DUF2798 domain-containing protein [Vibrio hangzhouensis]|uniref:DUF2798 domain-containing protein n=1 Tax=Vibrio hangzhouensis TaxID=462991 RepID=A0A1H6AFW2_9VIBR|nr:DUF2798 domain-containing protein [Vibrio hangzhouensis]SEG46957.1 Protein of unknown function [Vibrio hangzhouensis]
MSRESKEFYLFSTIMSIIMSGGMSLVMTLLNGSFVDTLSTWPVNWLTSFWVALPLSILVVPITNRAVGFFLALFDW